MTISSAISRAVRLIAAAGLALAALAMFSPAAGASAGTGPGTGWLRLAHLSPDTPPVDVYLYSFGDPHAKIVLHHVSYGTVSPYLRVPDGEYTIAMRGAGAAASSAPALSASIDVKAGQAYTVAGVGRASRLRLEVFRDRLKAPRDRALVRVIQASMTTPTVEITAGGQILSGRLAFASATPYVPVHPGTTDVAAAGSAQRASDRVKLSADSIYTLVVLDDAGHLKVAWLEDSAGSKVIPHGGVQTGFGGTAARPGASIAPWAALTGAGLAVAAGGLMLLRRHRPTQNAR